MKYTVIAPVYNELDNVEPLAEKIAEVMDKLGEDYEILLVDDGSTDGTFERLEQLTGKMEKVVVLTLTKNSGQTVALQAGFDHARGERIVTIDGDLQMDPAHIAEMVKKMDAENLDLVYLRKIYHNVPFMKRFASWIANRFRRIVSGDSAVDVGSNYKLYRQNVFKGMNFCSGLHRFFTGFMEIEGASMGYVEGTISQRLRGESKYTNWFRLRQGLADMFYFYMYKNRRAGAYKIIAALGACGLLATFLPIGPDLRLLLFALLALLVIYTLKLVNHALHVSSMRLQIPYSVKSILPEQTGTQNGRQG